MRRINTGDVIAVAVAGIPTPPVGIVHDCDDDAISLRLFSLMAGEFSGPEMLIRRRDIRATLWAYKMTDAQLVDHHIHRPGDDLWDMVPLGQFQDDWRIA